MILSPGKRMLSERSKKLLIIFAIVFTFAVLLFISYFGVEEIDHYFEKGSDYNAVYYVHLYEDRNKAKNYRLQAEVFRTIRSYYDEEERVTKLNRVYFPNGGSISFEDNDYCELEFGKRIYCSDDSGKDWYIELTTQKVR